MKIPEILFENDDYIILNKPSGMLSVPDGKTESLLELLRQNREHLFIVHRIDKDTSGCICFAKNEQAHRFLSQSFEHNLVKKIYHGIVEGNLFPTEKTIDAPIREKPGKNNQMYIHATEGKKSITHYKVLEQFGLYSLVEFRIETGRTHQIRVHMQNEQHPIICDAIYGDEKPIFVSQLKKRYNLDNNLEEEKPILNRLALHAQLISFEDECGKQILVEAPYFKDMKATLQQLKKWRGGK